MLSGWNSYVIGAVLCLASSQAQAQAQAQADSSASLRVDLRYEVAPELRDCPSSLEFRGFIADQLGYDPHQSGEALGLTVGVRPAETGLEATLDWTAGARQSLGERRFRSRNDDCRDMLTTVGFVVAVQLQLMAKERQADDSATSGPVDGGARDAPSTSDPNRTTSTAQGTKPPTGDGDQVDQPPAPEATRPTNWSLMVGGGPAVGYGLAPAAAGQGRLFLAPQYRWFGVELGAEATFTQSKRRADGGGFEHELRLATLATCGFFRSFSACVVGKGGRIQVRGLGVDRPASPNGFVGQLGPRLAYSLGLDGHLGIMARVEALYLLKSWSIDVNDTPVWAMPRVAAVAGVDLVARFP